MPEVKKTWRIGELLRQSTSYLSRKGIDHARLNCERLLGKTLSLDRVQLYLDFDRPLTTAELSDFRRLLQRRTKHEPLQHIIGETEFMSLPFQVNNSVLIPRPETELLVEAVVNKCANLSDDGTLRVLDIGTGSGCIAVSIASASQRYLVTGIDVSSAAIEVAKQNSAINGVESQIEFAVADIFGITSIKSLPRFDIIVSNPPYVSADEYVNLPEEIRVYEPGIAVSDKKDGLSFYHRLVQVADELLSDSGFLALEIGASQAEAVTHILQDTFGNISVRQDLNGRDRIVIAQREPDSVI